MNVIEFVDQFYEYKDAESFGDALRSLDKGIECFPMSAVLHALRGEFLTNILGRFEEGIRSCRRATYCDPLSAVAHASLANACCTVFLNNSRLGIATDPELIVEGVQGAEAAVCIDRNCSTANIALSILLGETNRFEESCSVAMETLERHPGNPFAMHNAAVHLIHAGRLREAEKLLEKSDITMPNEPIIMRHLAHVRILQDDFFGVVSLYRRCMLLDSFWDELREELARVEQYVADKMKLTPRRDVRHKKQG